MSMASQRWSPGDHGHGSLTILAVLSVLIGAASGLIGAWFRIALDQADQLRNQMIAWAYGLNFPGLALVILVCGAATALAAWLVRRFSPYASGSGIPHVEGVLNRELPPAPFLLVPVKFVGGLLAIGAGLALGREGPSVQMGACVADLIGKVFWRRSADCLVLLAAGAGAGLATAFNAPIAGAVFVLEELVRRFDTRVAIATFGALRRGDCRQPSLSSRSARFQGRPFALPRLWDDSHSFAAWSRCRLAGRGLQPDTSRRHRSGGTASALACRAACWPDWSRDWSNRLVRPPLDRGRGFDHPAHA